MSILTVTDNQCRAIIESAVDPVLVLWEEIDSLGYRHNRTILELLIPDFLGKVHFVSCLIDENPDFARGMGLYRIAISKAVPGLAAYHKKKAVAVIVEMLPHMDATRHFLEKVAALSTAITPPDRPPDFPPQNP